MRLLARLRARVRRNSDAGFNLVEISISTALMAVTSVAIVGILQSQTNAERDVTNFTVNHEVVRQAMVTMQRDLRSSEPLTEVSNPLDLMYRIDLKMYEDVHSNTPFQVRWRVVPATNELVREILDNNGAVTATTYRLRGVTNMTESAPMFEYFRANGDEYDLTLPESTPGTVAYCTVRVRIDLRAMPNEGRQPVQLVSDVQLRNKLPGADECPQG